MVTVHDDLPSPLPLDRPTDCPYTLVIGTREGVEEMRRILAVLFAVAGIVGFATVAQAGCGHDLDVAGTEGPVVATDSTTKPILPDQSGG